MNRFINLLYVCAIIFFPRFNNVDAAVADGIVVYCTGTGLKSASPLKFVVITNEAYSPTKTLTSTPGKNPRISPDGRYVAFDNGSQLFACRLKENASVVSLGSGAHPYWVKKGGSTYLFYSSQSGKVGFGSGKSYLRKINPSTLAWDGSATEIKYDGRSSLMKGGMGTNGAYACTGYPDCVLAKADPGGAVRSMGGGQKCNPSIAPTSYKMMILDDTDHRTLATYTNTGSRWAWAPGGYIQNPEWSTDEKWCTWVAGDHSGGQIYVGDMGAKKGYKINGASGTFPHYFKGTPGPTLPSLSVSPAKLEFTAEKDKSAPAAKSVTVSISRGNISGLKASENAAWLTTSVSGSKVTNTLSHSGLDAKSYSVTVQLTVTGAEPASYTVSLTVVEPQVLTSLIITPSNPILTFGSKQQFVAKAKDQNGKDMLSQPTITWSATGPGTINSSGLFSAGQKEGTATITAKGGGKTATTKATIIEQPAVALKINCGGKDVGDWKADQYSTGGSVFNFGKLVSTSGVSGAAPAEVYSTVRHNGAAYTIPSTVAANGNYTVRLHFNDGKGAVGDRKMNVTIEGKQVLTAYDIVAKAGGQNKAVIEQFTATVSDGNGMTIALAEGTGIDALVAGIEIFGGTTSADNTVEVLEPRGGESVKVGDVLHIKWKTIESRVDDVVLDISIDNGLSFLPITAKGSIDKDMNQWGDYAWTIPESMTHDNKTISLADKTCIIRVIEYNGTRNDVSTPFTIKAKTANTAFEARESPVKLSHLRLMQLQYAGIRLDVSHDGWHEVRLINANGATVAYHAATGAASYNLGAKAAAGLYLVKVDGAWGSFSRLILLAK